MKQCNRRGSVLLICLMAIMLVLSLVGAFLGVAAARCRATAEQARRAQALALAESALAAAALELAAPRPENTVSGSLATGFYSAKITRSGESGASITAVGRPAPVLGRAIEVRLKAKFKFTDGRWIISDWREAGR